MRKRQTGLTLVGLIFGGALLVIGATVAFRIIPAYIEYAKIERILNDLGSDAELRDGGLRPIRDAFAKRAQIDEITSVTGDDITLSKQDGKQVLEASYRKEITLFGNVGITISFDASSR